MDTTTAKSTPANKRRRLIRLALPLTILALILAMAWGGRYVIWVKTVNESLDSMQRGEFIKALEQARQCISMMSCIQDSKSLCISYRLMSSIYACRRQFQQAQVYNAKGLDIDKSVWGKGSVEYADDLQNLALMKRKQREFPESEKMYNEAIAIYQSRTGSDVECARAKALDAWVLIQQDKMVDAKKLLTESDQTLKQQFGDAHFERLVGLIESAYISKKEGKAAELNAALDTVYKMITEPKAFERSSAQTVVVLNLLAQMLRDRGQEDKALKIFEIAEINCKSSAIAGGYNTFMADILETHAKLLSKLGHQNESEELRRRAAEIRSIHFSMKRITLSGLA